MIFLMIVLKIILRSARRELALSERMRATFFFSSKCNCKELVESKSKSNGNQYAYSYQNVSNLCNVSFFHYHTQNVILGLFLSW